MKFPWRNDALETFDLIHDLYARHSLGWANRKFLYDPLYNDYLPMYNDGNINIPANICEQAKVFRITPEVQTKVKLIRSEFLKRTLQLERLMINKNVSLRSY